MRLGARRSQIRSDVASAYNIPVILAGAVVAKPPLALSIISVIGDMTACNWPDVTEGCGQTSPRQEQKRLWHNVGDSEQRGTFDFRANTKQVEMVWRVWRKA